MDEKPKEVFKKVTNNVKYTGKIEDKKQEIKEKTQNIRIGRPTQNICIKISGEARGKIILKEEILSSGKKAQPKQSLNSHMIHSPSICEIKKTSLKPCMGALASLLSSVSSEKNLHNKIKPK